MPIGGMALAGGRETGLNFYACDRYARNVTTEGMYAKRFHLCDLRAGGYEIPLHMDFLSNPGSNGPFGPFWRIPLLESRLIPAGKSQVIFVSVTGKRELVDIPSRGERAPEYAWQYEANGDDVELSFATKEVENIFLFRRNQLVRWRIISGPKTVTLSFKRLDGGLTILSSNESKPVLRLEPLRDEGIEGLRMRALGKDFRFVFEPNVVLFGSDVGPVSLLSSVNISGETQTQFRYNGFDMAPTELMESAGQLDVYKKFHPTSKKSNEERAEKGRNYATIQGRGPLFDLDVTWDMATGFPVLSRDELCLVEGAIGKWGVNTRLSLLRSYSNPARWDRMSMDWVRGRKVYADSGGYRMEENIILTPGASYLEPRSGRSTIPHEGKLVYRVSYDKEGHVKQVKIN